MKPHRIRMTHNLVLGYGLYQKMQIYVCTTPPSSTMTPAHSHTKTQRPWRATPQQMLKFHSDEYIDFLRTVTPDTLSSFSDVLANCLCLTHTHTLPSFHRWRPLTVLGDDSQRGGGLPGVPRAV